MAAPLQPYFRLADRPKRQELLDLGVEETPGFTYRKVGYRVELKAKRTGEHRPPKAGEWYLSGAIPEAYRAPMDFNVPYDIVKIVTVRRVEFFKEVL